ncbi:MAG: type II secretion system protein [Candidatus Adlerbacteria bacterium]|nr:type II secretion system protein [Candidatus Adlerbacteria bacterium]
MHTRGFTLIELMVSVTIFIIVMVISLGSLLSISTAERKAESLKVIMNNLHFGLESMSRSVRTGITYHCGTTGVIDTPNDCGNTGNPYPAQNYFAFEAVGGNINSSGDQVVYYLETNPATCDQTGTGGCIMRSVASGGNPLPITAPEVVITSLMFYVIGSAAEFQNDSTHSQPKVVITLTGQVVAGTAPSTKFSLQTSVTQRLYDQ